MKAKQIPALALLLLLAAGTLHAQKGNIGFVYPAGAQRGTTVELTVGGQGLSRATGIIFSGEGVSGTLIPRPEGQRPRRKNRNIGEEDNLQLADAVKFRVTVDKKAGLGLRDVRLVMPNGVTNRLYFEVGQLPDVLEDGKAALSGSASALPVTFNGQVLRADTDRFRFHAEKGQQLVIAAKGRVFVPYMADAVPGWFQPVMHLYDDTGREVAFSDDYTFHVDPVIFYQVPHSGDYGVDIYDALYRGREDFVYRIDVGELPFVTGIYPIGGLCGSRNRVELRGYNLSSSRMSIRPREVGRIPVTVKGKGGLVSNTFLFQSDTCREVSVRKGKENDTRGSALSLQPFEAFNGRITRALQEYWFVFRPPKERGWHFEVVARRAGSPADMRLSLFDASGTLIAHFDDVEDAEDYMNTHHADPQFNRRFPANNPIYIRLTEAQGHFGEDYAFRFFITPSQPDFSLQIEPSTFTAPEGGTGMFNVIANRKQGFGGDIELRLDGIPAGCKISGAHINKGSRKTIVTVTVPEGAKHKTWHPVLTGQAKAGGKMIERTGRPVETMMQAFYYKHLMPMEDFRMEVGEMQPFTLSVELPPDGQLRLTRKGDAKVPLKVRVNRRNGYDKPITLMMRTAESGCKAEAVVVEGDSGEGVLEVELRGKNWRDKLSRAVVYGVVKGSTKRIAGKARNAYVAAVTAYTPAFDVFMPGTGIKPTPKPGKKKR